MDITIPKGTTVIAHMTRSGQVIGTHITLLDTCQIKDASLSPDYERYIYRLGNHTYSVAAAHAELIARGDEYDDQYDNAN